MLFNTLEFGVFFTAVLLLYYILPFRWQNHMLLAASYAFYAAWDWRFLSLIFISTTVDFYVGKLLAETENLRRKKHILFWSVLFNLGFLGFFKYFNFFAGNLHHLLALLGLHTSLTSLNIILPVGISFYTFQSMSYTLDIYRGDMKPTARYLDFALNVAFFPHMVAGPIQRAHSLLDQITAPRQTTRDQFAEGLYLILWGLFKKMVIADNMALITEPIFAQAGGFTAGQVLTGALAFAFQIYGDFSGYSDIARGTARLLGFRLMVNFNLPYLATNPQDFWRRWHISLSTWLRDYLYISLGGSRKGEARTYLNLLLTMLLGGLWHGAAWTFVLWGFYHGALLMAHRFLQQHLPKRTSPLSPFAAGVWQWTRIAFMFVLTLYGWLIFRAQSLDQLLAMTRALLAVSLDPATVRALTKILLYCSVLLAVQFLQHRRNNLDAVRQTPMPVQVGFYLICYYLIVLVGAFNAQSFIYFQF
jgi:alginate O-acetyltransferase complex protein AlgI